MKAIRLTWSGGRTNYVNYGDLLSKYLVEALSGRRVVYAGAARADLIGIGSIFHKVASHQWQRPFLLKLRPLIVWGTGTIHPQDLRLGRFVDVRAVRGPRTAALLHLPADIPMGDPGLLAPILLEGSKIKKKHRIGLVPHVADVGNAAVNEIASALSAIVVDLRNADIVETTRTIAACDYVVSSSLHGLVIADAFSIPSVHVRITSGVVGGNWKFHDYYESLGRPYAQLTPAELLRADWRLEDLNCAEPARVATVQRALTDAFKGAPL